MCYNNNNYKETKMANTLDNFSLYLWHNPEGYHVTVTTNYNTPKEKRSFFSFGGQTFKSWRAYNLNQPEPLKEFFYLFKEQYKQQLKKMHNKFWISKLAVNTGTNGRRTAPGVMILQQENERFSFVVQFADHTFEGDFDESLLSERQKKGAKGRCIGAYIWKDDDVIEDYVEAF